MKAAILKEIRLVLHPSTYPLMLLGALVLVPSWAYGAIFIYGILMAFNNGVNAREMRDLSYSFALPISRKDMVRARIATMMGVEAIMLLLMLAFVFVRIPLGINEAAAGVDPVGTAANLYLVGFGFAIYGVLNLVFYPLYYRNPRKVGIPFIIACIPAAILIVVVEALPYLPIVGFSALAVPGLIGLSDQLLVLLGGVLVFLACGLLAMRLSARSFAAFDA